MFAVVRHPDAGLGTAPDSALEQMRINGWRRVSDFRPEPAAFHLPDFADAEPVDEDEPQPEQPAEPKPTPKRRAAETTEESAA